MPEALVTTDPVAGIALTALFMPGVAVATAWPSRQRISVGGLRLIRDDMGPGSPVCVTAFADRALRVSTPPGYAVSVAPGGGFQLTHDDPSAPLYWLPLMPRQVRQDGKGRLLQIEPAALDALGNQGSTLQLGFAGAGAPVEAVIWRLPAGQAPHRPSSLERSAWFTLGSHTAIRSRVDVYRHLVGGKVFEDRLAWPHPRRVCSENDAHSLHLALSGLTRAAGEPVLAALQSQLLLAVLDRQGADGGFRHGEWTETDESHYRLHCSAMHLMMDRLAEQRADAVERALSAAAAFLARQAVRLSFGQWLPHDELEASVEKMKLGPFKWVPSTVFGKAESNMLVLNSHLDATIALDRYADVTGDTQYCALVDSARQATRAVLGLRPAEPLYRALFWLVELTFLPAVRAAALPIWKRALKRLTWQVLIPRLPDLKARFPRWVMPGGYIDRELTLRTWAHDYHVINLMDLARYLRRFDEPVVRQVLRQGLDFTRRSGILERWRELDYQRYALGFWAEALYHVCMLFADDRYRQWLAEAMLVLEDLQMGQPPSLLGANSEALPLADQLPCPGPADARLRVANLGRRGAPELLVVNASRVSLPLVWETPPADPIAYRFGAEPATPGTVLQVPARGWLWGRAAQ